MREHSLTRPLTVRTVEPEGIFYDERTGSFVRVRPHYMALNCEGCEWYVQRPTRLGRDKLEKLRKQHIEQIHWHDLTSGRFQITEDELVFDPAD